MKPDTRTLVIATTASTTQTLPDGLLASQVIAVVGQAGGATTVAATNYTVQTAAPTSGTQVQFTGTPSAPSGTLTFNAALTANGLLYVTYVPVGGLPSNV